MNLLQTFDYYLKPFHYFLNSFYLHLILLLLLFYGLLLHLTPLIFHCFWSYLLIFLLIILFSKIWAHVSLHYQMFHLQYQSTFYSIPRFLHYYLILILFWHYHLNEEILQNIFLIYLISPHLWLKYLHWNLFLLLLLLEIFADFPSIYLILFN